MSTKVSTRLQELRRSNAAGKHDPRTHRERARAHANRAAINRERMSH